MGIFSRRKKQKRSVAFMNDFALESLKCSGYTSLDHCPEIMKACKTIADLIASMTIYLMSNTAQGDKRITNALSRTIDINPMPYMTRFTWMSAIVMNLLLYGKGNSVALPKTKDGYLTEIEPIPASRVVFEAKTTGGYVIMIDGKPHDPSDVLHFVMNPDKNYMWKGRGITVDLKDIADNLKQAAETENAFMSSKWKPSLIIKVDALTDEFASPEGRKRLIDSYIETADAGEPWLIPSEQFSVEQIRPLSLADLAIADNVKLDRRAVASVIGVPAFLLGVGEYNKDEWNNFVQNTIRPIAIEIQQEMTKKLIISDKWYIKFNILSLMDWDLKTISDVFGSLSDRGFVTGNEVRDRIGLEPLKDLDELRILENYIPASMSGNQKKLEQGDD